MLIYLQTIETDKDKSKFEQIYEAYRGLMFHVAFKILEQEQDAEDAVHHAFVKIAENITKISEPVCPKTEGFVVTIVENKSIDILRRRKRHQEISLDAVTYGIPVRTENEDVLSELILKLPAKQRQVIWLKYYYGYSLREIASMLNISLAAAIKTDQRARKKLEAMYDMYEEDCKL